MFKPYSGSGFDDVNKENNLITIGGIACDVASATTTQVSCNIGKSPGGSNQPFIVQVLGKGNSKFYASSSLWLILTIRDLISKKKI